METRVQKDVEETIYKFLTHRIASKEEAAAGRQRLLEAAEKENDHRAMGYYKMVTLERYFFFEVDFEKALEEIKQILSIAKRINDGVLSAMGYWHYGTYYDLQGDYLTAFDHYWTAFKKLKTKDWDEAVRGCARNQVYADIGACLMSSGEYEHARHYLNKIDLSNYGGQFRVVLFCNFVICSYELKDYEGAFKYFQMWEMYAKESSIAQGFYYSMVVWKYILFSGSGREEEMDGLMREILELPCDSNEAEDLLYLINHRLEMQKYQYLDRLLDKLEEHLSKYDDKARMLVIVKIRLRYLKEIQDEASYQAQCIRLHQIQQEVDEQKKKLLKISLSKYIDAQQKEEEHEELLRTKEFLKHKSEYDEMTDLPNRYLLNEFCEKAFDEAAARHEKISVEILDVDFFKQFNDNYGHPEGDKCLITIAEQIKKTIGENELGARYGGDEFVIIRKGKTDQEILNFMNRLRQSVLDCNIPHAFSKAADCVTISQGAMNKVPEQGDNWKSFLKSADEALYEAKKVSKNTIVMAGASVE